MGWGSPAGRHVDQTVVIDKRLNEPTICTVWVNGRLVFAGVDLSSAAVGIDYESVRRRMDNMATPG